MTVKRPAALAALIGLTACGGKDFTCGLGTALAGSWQMSFIDRSGGGCGPVPTVTVIAPTVGLPPASCAQVYRNVSADQCSVAFRYACPLSSNTYTGTGTVTGHADQVSARKVTALETVEIVTNVGSCASGYDVTYEQL